MSNIKKAMEVFPIGSKVRMLGDDEIGTVVGYNTSNSFFYPGERYPLIVAFHRGTFEYTIDGIEMVEKGEGLTDVKNNYKPFLPSLTEESIKKLGTDEAYKTMFRTVIRTVQKGVAT